MGFLSWLLGEVRPAVSPVHTNIPMDAKAQTTMRGLNRNVLCGYEDGHIVFIEDHADPDGRLFRLEYRSNLSGTQATAWCRFKPWSNKSYAIHQCHLFSTGQICLGSSTHNLHDAVMRARYWTAAYSYLREHGSWPG